MPLTDDTRAQAREIIARYPQARSALLPMLHLVQAEEGYVSPAGVALCAEELGLTKAEVGAVATFYTMYKRRPCGDWLVSVCTNLSCQLLGGEDVYARLSEHLGVGHDETARPAEGEDGPAITLEHAECLAACDYAPVMTVNYEFFDNATPDSAQGIVDTLRRGERPTPTRGDSLADFRDVSLQLAGFDAASRAAMNADGQASSAAESRPTPPSPTDSRGVEAPGAAAPDDAGRYGVPGGVTESVLGDEQAARTYGTGPADAGATPVTGEPSPRRDEGEEP